MTRTAGARTRCFQVMLAVGLLITGLAAWPPASTRAQPDRATYTNPVTAGVVDTFPDPSMIRGKDGFWYAYGTQNPVFQSRGEDGERILPILRSSDMVHWEYAGQAFEPSNQPGWHEGSRLWATDIRYVRGRYYLYYSVPDRNTVGLATAPTPTGPWTDRGSVLPSPSGCPTGNIDQALFTDTDGTRYLYWGSYDTVCVARMNADATRIEGAVTPVATGRRMEGAFVVHRDGYYYLFYSDAGCCDGSFSGYQVKVGRSTSPTGPFTDDQGIDLRAPTTKGAIVAGATGNRWIGPGHNAIQTDLSGQDWLVYHGIPTENPDLKPAENGTLKLTRRPMLIDRLDWIDGWPVVRAGPSDDAQPAPITKPLVGSDFNDRTLGELRAAGEGWSSAHEPDARGYATHADSGDPSYLVTPADAPANLRAEADLRVRGAAGSAGLTIAYRDRDNHVDVWLDPRRHALVTDVVIDGHGRGESVTALPAGFEFGTWHNVAVELRGTRMTVEVSESRLRDAVAVDTRELPRVAAGPGMVGVAARGAGAAADNLSAAALAPPTAGTLVPPPGQGTPLPEFSDEFNGDTVPGTAPDSPWRWVRGLAPGLTMGDGTLSWPTQDGELYLDENTASVLLRDAPEGNYTVETKIDFAPEQDAQQAGLLLYGNDNRYFKLVHSVLPIEHTNGALTHASEFGKEGARPTTTPPTPVAHGPMFGGPTGETMWLRLSHRVDATNDEHEVLAATSRDGQHWVPGGVWTLPIEGNLHIGLVSMNKTGAVARFDYLRTYRD